MVQFFKPQPKVLSNKAIEITIDNLDHHLTAVGRHQGKACFVEGALPGEVVSVQMTDQKKNHSLGKIRKVLSPSAERQTPFCAAYESCGGCNAQFMPRTMQWQAKQEGVIRLFKQLSKIDLPAPVWIESGEDSGYRRVCRLAVKFDPKTKRVQLGFREKNSQALIEISGCPVLTPALSALIQPLRQLIRQLSAPKLLGHVELYDTESGLAVLLRHTGQISTKDELALKNFAETHHCAVLIQNNDETVAISPIQPHFYQLHDLTIGFQPGDFLQVNAAMNEKMVSHALTWLDVQPTDHVLDLYCGIGNFTLPIAKQAASVTGLEVVNDMVSRARANAEQNQIPNAEFHRADLTKLDEYASAGWHKECYDLVLLDPGRAGAADVMPWLAKSKARRIVYVSCNPVSAARDCAQLAAKYRVVQWGLLDMFPHTGHVESLFLFEQK